MAYPRCTRECQQLYTDEQAERARRLGVGILHSHERSGPREGRPYLILRHAEFGSRLISRTCPPEDFEAGLTRILVAAAANRRRRDRRHAPR